MCSMSEHEELVSHANIEPERFTLEPAVRTAIAEVVGLVLQATLPDALTSSKRFQRGAKGIAEGRKP
ncbi:hypothetical protein L1987_13828 [Smallanthus sonchifolius]|uniref:Uncharacterized protein n=1 Tax=Smallanthus sonchifolius TaxID=185202 RepID=A0ACB9JJ60_9ASTR|nr:hypothetical protein L1987_13828 [Smallanthus sonchifolius]